ncbi:MAG: ABC transporter ATP-binding protein [Aggregatilineales bacterium]
MSETTTSDITNRIPHIKQLELRGIVKKFPGVLACDHIDFDVQAGEIHALLGENGAGKSTLMKILYGLYQPDEGEVLINGAPVEISSPQDAIKRGIGMIHQHFMLVPSLTVAENVALGLKTSFTAHMNIENISRDLLALSERYNLKVHPNVPIWQLSVGEQQRVEILRAIYKGADLLIMDEPTAVLTPLEVDDLMRVLRQMSAEGRLIIFISHKLQEVLNLSDRVSVLRDGRHVGEIATADATKSSLAQMMVGRPIVMRHERTFVERGAIRLTVDAVSARNHRGNLGLNGVSLELHSGEIVGVAGVSGNGQHELAEVIAGLRHVEGGQVRIDNTDVTGHPPAKMLQHGLSYIPEERMVDGVVKDFTVAENLVLQDHGNAQFSRRGIFINFKAIKDACLDTIKRYEIKTPGTDTPIKNLSGGNIQKLILGRELARKPSIIIAAQPTRGVDIGAIEYIHKCLLDEREKGTAILLISEDLDEIRALSDRIVVMYEGQIVGIVEHEEAVSNEQLGAMMAGVHIEI